MSIGGIFASHYFTINPQPDETGEIVAVNFFSSSESSLRSNSPFYVLF
jgi:hypothetical protein